MQVASNCENDKSKQNKLIPEMVSQIYYRNNHPRILLYLIRFFIETNINPACTFQTRTDTVLSPFWFGLKVLTDAVSISCAVNDTRCCFLILKLQIFCFLYLKIYIL